MAKAIALLSGGLDSTLAAALVRSLGIEVIGLHIHILFDTDQKRSQYVAKAAEDAGIKMRTVDLSKEHLEVVRHPRYGYGAGMNPCIDCRIFML
ncbi:MnmA/TRMU family protein, partial [Candidatus Bipolaricaulota bacterium]|nr:MnmA/TRMU family protein [Candidatus Bipolaricaulota bacterium]